MVVRSEEPVPGYRRVAVDIYNFEAVYARWPWWVPLVAWEWAKTLYWRGLRCLYVCRVFHLHSPRCTVVRWRDMRLGPDCPKGRRGH